ncbi:hypothetical protein [Saccharicrinis sp. GN24d3]|uniref:hypothetical protein n=1 Tax=Saccharicrinis sp. GN24d3 TaxID=3458416 RepID=UPI0040351237
MIKIYLTYKEIEKLCFSKFIELIADRLSDTKSTKDRKYLIEINEDGMIRDDTTIVVLFSSISMFEIPKVELNQFKNQLRIPNGMLRLSNRKVKDSSNPQGELLGMNEEKICTELYLPIRRGLTQLLLWGYKYKKQQATISQFYEALLTPNDFTKQLILELLSVGGFPILRVNTGDYKSDNYYRLVWWGKFCIDHLLIPNQSSLNEHEIKKHKKWFLDFDIIDLAKNHELLRSMPDLFNENSTVMLGYFFACMTKEQVNAHNIGDQINEILQEIRDVDNEYEILCWAIFFQALFIEEVDYIFPNPLIQDQFLSIEKNSISLVNYFKEKQEKIIGLPLTFRSIDEEDLIYKQLFLKESELKETPLILSNKQLREPFKNDFLFGDNKKQVGLINQDWFNYININRNFDVEVKLSGDFESNAFYGDLSLSQKNQLKKKGFAPKVKPLSQLVSKDKKVLVIFISENSSYLLPLYEEILKNEKCTIKEVIVIWMINVDADELHSTQFGLKKSEVAADLENRLGKKVTLIVKNIHNSDNTEVVRNIKVSLKEYTLKQVELVDNIIDDDKCYWLIEATQDYVIKSEKINYYCCYSG